MITRYQASALISRYQKREVTQADLDQFAEMQKTAGTPCPHFYSGFKMLAPGLCPYCKIAVQNTYIQMLETRLEAQDETVESIRQGLRAIREDLTPSPKPQKQRMKWMKDRLLSVFSGLKARWKKGGIK